LKNEDVHRVLAGITIPNEASVELHRRFGFTDVGVFIENGRKFDRYWDVLWMQRPLILAGA
jgi:phosphinothricin acetyltransferase